MLSLNTTYNLENNLEKMDRTAEGSAILEKLLKKFGMYTHYIDSRNVVEGLEAVVRFYIWSEEGLVKKLDLLFDNYKKINDFLLGSQLPEEDKKKLVDNFNSTYFSLKFILTDIYNIYKNIREKEEEEKKKKEITEKFLSDLEKL